MDFTPATQKNKKRFFMALLKVLCICVGMSLVGSSLAQSPLVTGATSAYNPSFMSTNTPTQNTFTVPNTIPNNVLNTVPNYCQTPANFNRPECLQNTTTQNFLPVTTSIPNSSIPNYCATPANANRPECRTNTQNNTVPSYCSNPLNANRTECQGLYATSVVATNQSVPGYCVAPQYQSRPECIQGIAPVTTLVPTAVNTINTINTGTTRPAYCQTPANQTRPECTGATAVSSTSYRPCIAGVIDPYCTPASTMTPPFISSVATASQPFTAPPFTAPPFTAPANCPDGVVAENCLNTSDFALPTPPAPINCQQAGNNLQAVRDFCAAIFFTHPNAYLNGSANATLRRFNNFSFMLRSPFAGHAYLFTRYSDGSIQALLPNQRILQPIRVRLYNQVHLPENANQTGVSYAFTANQDITEIFYVVLSQPAPANTFTSVRSDIDLQRILLSLGVTEGIYHGIASASVTTSN